MTANSGNEKYLTATESALGHIAQIPEEHRQTPGVCGHWTLKDMVGHLAFWDGHIADSLTAKATGAPRPRITEPHDLVNAREADKRAKVSWSEVMAELRSTRDRLLPLLEDPGGDDGHGIHEHWEEHGAQIAAFAAKFGVRAEIGGA